jgi:hypothetical protein
VSAAATALKCSERRPACSHPSAPLQISTKNAHSLTFPKKESKKAFKVEALKACHWIQELLLFPLRKDWTTSTAVNEQA